MGSAVRIEISLPGPEPLRYTNSARLLHLGVIPEMPQALSGIVTNAGACCDPG
jgi:hypothetical protein